MKDRGEIDPEETAIIDTKSRLGSISSGIASTEMPWMSDSRGSNRAIGKKHLLMIGSPRPNLGAAAARYQLMFGELVDLDHKVPTYVPVIAEGKDEYLLGSTGAAQRDFRRYYLNLLEAELIQGIGRLRANCRGNDKSVTDQEPLLITVIGDVAIPMPVHLREVGQVLDGQAKESLEILRDGSRLQELVGTLSLKGQEVTAISLADALELNLGLVKQYVSERRLQGLKGRTIQKALAP